MKAVILLHNGNTDWKYQVAKNYTQLNFDYCMADRIGDSDYSFYQTTDIDRICLDNYEYAIVLKPGIIFEYSYWESSVRRQVEGRPEKFIFFNNPNMYIINPRGTGEITLKLNRDYGIIDSATDDSFALTHASAMSTLVHNSNISYIIHNEIPVPKKLHNRLDFAMTVSSGFYINYVLNMSEFDEYTHVHHIDVSTMSLYVREYTINNWDGKDFYNWMDHIYEKFPLLELFNGKTRLHSHHPAARRVWQHVLDTFGEEQWVEHWQKYKKCKHTYNVCNFGDNALLEKTLSNLNLSGNGAFWWNGSLKRLPANILKTSDQSFDSAKRFMSTLCKFNSGIAAYGSDHCVTAFNGISIEDALAEMSSNSRNLLWKEF